MTEVSSLSDEGKGSTVNTNYKVSVWGKMSSLDLQIASFTT